MVNPHVNTTGGPHYIGYIPDFLVKIQQILGVHFKIHEAPGNSFGYRQSDGLGLHGWRTHREGIMNFLLPFLIY